MRCIILPAGPPRLIFDEWSCLICGKTYYLPRGMTPKENQQEQR